MRDLSQQLDGIFVAPKFQQDTRKLETLLMSLELKNRAEIAHTSQLRL